MFLERAGKRLVNADANILQAEEALKEARVQRDRRQEELEAGQARLETLRAESTHSCGLHPHPLSGGGSDIGAQITSLQQMVNQLQAERDAFAERLKEQEGAEPVGKKPRMREDVVINTVEELVQWMHARQQEMIEAVSRGSAHGGRVVGPRSSAIETVVDTRRVCELRQCWQTRSV